jgi:uncharacterized repeat protein (TIGR03847 family)
MARMEIELDPVIRLTTDAIGQPGQRVFYLQGQDDHQIITLLIEKVQLQTLAVGVEQFFSELIERLPDLTPAADDYDEPAMKIEAPVDPLFRIGEIGLAYDSDRDLACLVANEILSEEVGEDDAGVVRFWCSRSQLLALCAWGTELAGRGRPLCPQCGEPMDPAGHFCPKKNGHKH